MKMNLIVFFFLCLFEGRLLVFCQCLMGFCYDSIYDSLLLVDFSNTPWELFLLWRTGKDIML